MNERIRQRRADLGKTQEDVALAVGVAQSTYAGWETGTRMPSHRYMPALAATLCTTIDWLYGQASA